MNDFIIMENKCIKKKAYFHLPGLFEFFDLYEIFLPLFYCHREYFYEWCEIGSVYGAPADCIWGGGRVGFGYDDSYKIIELLNKYGISARLTFSNSLIEEIHLTDRKCNNLCKTFENFNNNGENTDLYSSKVQNGVIIYSDLLLNYIKTKYPDYYFVSTTTKVITDFNDFISELKRSDFKYVVPDFRLNKAFDKFKLLSIQDKDKIEFICNECCDIACIQRKKCYENVSKKNLGLAIEDFDCKYNKSDTGYRFSDAMKNPSFISIEDIENVYLPMGFSNFKIEGRGLGSALILEFLLYYLTKPEYHLIVREEIYLDNMLDIF